MEGSKELYNLEYINVSVENTTENALRFLKWLFKRKPENQYIEVTKGVTYAEYAINPETAVIIARKFTDEGKEVYFGPNPRFRIPESKSGRAGDEDVNTCLALFLDFDYKKEVSGVSEDVARELEEKGYAIFDNCIYIKHENKIIEVSKPKFEDFCKELEQKLAGLGLTIDHSSIVDSGFGYHVYFRLDKPIEPDQWRKLQKAIIKVLGGDEKVSNPSRIMRMPGTINRKYEAYQPICKVLRIATKDVNAAELEKALKKVLKESFKEIEKEKYVFVKEEDIAAQIAEVLDEVYQVGYRNQICLGLSAILAKAGFEEEAAVAIVEKLATYLKDEEVKNRVEACRQTYKKWNDPSKRKEVSEQPLFTAIKALLISQGYTDKEAEDRATEIFDKVAEIIGYDKYYVRVKLAERKRKGTVFVKWLVNSYKGIWIDDEIKCERNIFLEYRIADIKKVQVIDRPDTEEEIFEITFRNERNGECFTVSGTIPDIAEYIKQKYKNDPKVLDYLRRLVDALKTRVTFKVIVRCLRVRWFVW